MDQNSPTTPGAGQPNRLVPPDNLPGTASPVQPPRPPVPPAPAPSSAPQPEKSQGIDLRFPDAGNAPRPGSLANPPAPAPDPSVLKTPTGPQISEYKSTIRTMADDISKVKIGQQPSGTEVQKTVTAPTKMAPPPTPLPTPGKPLPQGPTITTRLGEIERAKPLAPSMPMPRSNVPPAPQKPSQIILPDTPRGTTRSRSVFYLIILAIIALGGILYWVLTRNSGETATVSPTPSLVSTTTPVPTPVKTLGSLISAPSDTIVLATTGKPDADFVAKINALVIDPGTVHKIIISEETKGAGDLGMTDLLDRFLLSYPASLKSTLGDDSLILAFGQREAFTANGQLNLNAQPQKRIAFLTEVKDPVALSQVLSGWEATMTDTFASIFGLNKTKAATPGFLTNIYNGVTVRYRNFAQPDRTIDYATVNAPNGKLYLLVSGSRESALSITDLLR